MAKEEPLPPARPSERWIAGIDGNLLAAPGAHQELLVAHNGNDDPVFVDFIIVVIAERGRAYASSVPARPERILLLAIDYPITRPEMRCHALPPRRFWAAPGSHYSPSCQGGRRADRKYRGGLTPEEEIELKVLHSRYN
jgi:hypothetical protein